MVSGTVFPGIQHLGIFIGQDPDGIVTGIFVNIPERSRIETAAPIFAI
jgi:hypothetical protein